MDKKDLQLLGLLAQNCRISHTTLGKALNLSKDAVTYRIARLKQAGYLREAVLFIDARCLGFTRYHILIQFESDIPNKTALYEKLNQHPFVMWINSFIGRYDIQIIVDATDGFHLNRIREQLFELCHHKIKEYSILTHLYDLEFTHLNPDLDIPTPFTKKNDHSFSDILTTTNFPVNPEFQKYQPTGTEAEMLNLLADSPQESLIDIARKLHIDRQTVKKRIANLIQKKIILNFGGIPNVSQFGYVTYYLLVRVQQNTPMQIFKKPFLKLRNIFYAGRMIGDYDMILYLNAKTPEELNGSIELFKSEIGKYIVHYDLLVQDKVHFWRQYTKGIHAMLTSVL